MNIQRGSRPHRLFEFAIGIWNVFVEGGYPTWKYEERTNLCHFVRMVGVYMPLAILTNLLVWIAAVGTFVVLPIWLFAFTGYLYTLGAIASIVFVVLGSEKILEWRREYRRNILRRQEVVRVAARDTGPGFLAIAGEFLAAKKSKVCPVINFTKEGSHATDS